MQNAIQEYIDYLHNEQGTSYNTEISYARDLKKAEEYFQQQKIDALENVTATNLNSYMLYLERERFSPATVSRNIAALRSFYRYMMKRHLIETDPSDGLKLPKVEKKAPAILSVEQVDRFLQMPDLTTDKGIRDKAMLELLYATGIRVSELIHLKTDEINLRVGYITCAENGRERIIPFGKSASEALKRYTGKVRARLLKDTESEYLFVNCSGKPMSRQGFWKVLKSYAVQAGIEGDITPHTFRHSFATHMIQNGADLKSVQEMMGHADISSTQVYLNMGIYKIKEVYDKAHPRK